MEINQPPKWKRFEALVAKLQKALSPDAIVTPNDNILGRRSGVLRQIDISVRKSVGQFDILAIIDCKDYKVPVDVKDVEEFLGLVNDVVANKGALVSASGFTEAAKTRARDAGVDVYRLVDAEQQDWQTYVAIPVVWDFRGLGAGHFIIRGSSAICQELARQDPSRINVYDADHSILGTTLTMLWGMWNRREISDEPGPLRLHIKPDPMFVKGANGQFERIEIIGEFEVLQRLYFGQLPLTKITGLKDEATGNLILPGNAEIVTDVMNMVDVEENWLRIPSLDSLVVKPVFVFTALDSYPSSNPPS